MEFSDFEVIGFCLFVVSLITTIDYMLHNPNSKFNPNNNNKRNKK